MQAKNGEKSIDLTQMGTIAGAMLCQWKLNESLEKENANKKR